MTAGFLGALATSALIIIVVTVAAVALLVALERRTPRHGTACHRRVGG